MSEFFTTELTVLLRSRTETDLGRNRVDCSEYDITWPDGSPVQTDLRRFCRFGSRLLVGRRSEGGTVLVRLTIYPVPGLEAALTRPGRRVRCRRLYTIRSGDTVRFHLIDGTPTEAVFQISLTEARLLRWLQIDRMSPGEPFWLDLAS